MKKYIKLLIMSLCAIFVVAGLSIIYGFIAHRAFTLRYIFDANFYIGIIVMILGIVVMFLPSFLFTKNSKSLDRFTYVERSFKNREARQSKARTLLWLGLFIMILAGLIQMLLSVII